MRLGLLLLCACLNLAQAAELTVQVQGAMTHDGLLRLGLFDNAETFASDTPTYGVEVQATAGTVAAVFSDIPAGRYVLAVFQDQNHNQQLDKNFFGIPSELYGFSQRDKAGRPTFEEAVFQVSAHTSNIIIIQLR
jgi:uncharacterized protein (DUF2141 family)